MLPFFMVLWNNRLFKFLLVGGTATLLQMALLMVFVESGLMRPIVASAVSYVLSALYNYAANFYVTFCAAKTKRHSETAPKFLVVSAVGVSVNTAVFGIAEYFLDFYVISQIVAILVTLHVNYFLHRFWIYRR